MKANITTVSDAVFLHRLCWWSNWIDVSIINYGYSSYLVQMSISRTNKKKFRIARTTGDGVVAKEAEKLGDLTQMP